MLIYRIADLQAENDSIRNKLEIIETKNEKMLIKLKAFKERNDKLQAQLQETQEKANVETKAAAEEVGFMFTSFPIVLTHVDRQRKRSITLKMGFI